MKLITFVGSFLILSLCSQAQFKVTLGAGASFGHSPVVEGSLGYSWPLFNLTGGIQAHTSNKVTAGCLFQLKAGHDIPIGNDWGVNPVFGYSYSYQSSDLKYLNTGHTLLGIEVYKMFVEDVGIYGAYTNTGRINIVSFGMRGYF